MKNNKKLIGVIVLATASFLMGAFLINLRLSLKLLKQELMKKVIRFV